ncbi:MAG: nitroreductase family protein [Abditibacteriales bacterium]|nr:nitroreductase family protein [Abditibacteriales bacterium]MDW8365709.1 nitroreductase family protein [Abditibacteriales bacterium]
MDFFTVLQARRSIRAFHSTPVEEAIVWRIVEAANCAPSAGNLQAYTLVLVRDPQRKRALAKAAWEQAFIAQAPVVLVFLADALRSQRRYGQRGATLYAVQDATIACAYAQMAATALGLGSCWVGAFDETAVRSIVGAPPDLRPVAMLPIGYAAESPPPTGRRALHDLVHHEQVSAY